MRNNTDNGNNIVSSQTTNLPNKSRYILVAVVGTT